MPGVPRQRWNNFKGTLARSSARTLSERFLKFLPDDRRSKFMLPGPRKYASWATNIRHLADVQALRSDHTNTPVSASKEKEGLGSRVKRFLFCIGSYVSARRRRRALDEELT